MPNYHLDNTADILLEVALGSEAAFTRLYYLWEPRLSAFIFRITKSKELTAEIVQDVFLKIWMSRETLENVSNFKAYLFTVSKNQAINALKKTLREMEHMRQLGLEIQGVPPTEEIDREEVYSIIDQAILQLSDRQREVFLLSRYERLTYQQIADKLGIGKESVKTHLKLATGSVVQYLSARIIRISLLIGYFSEKF